MKFSLPPKKLKPNIGTQRIVVKFAWLPKRLSDTRTCIWLERYVSKQVFREEYVRDIGDVNGYYIYEWCEVEVRENK